MEVKMKKKFKKNDQVKYIGKGFLGFDKNKPIAVFKRYDGNHNTYVRFENTGNDILVFTHEIEKA